MQNKEFYDFENADKNILKEKNIYLLGRNSVFIEKTVELGKDICICSNNYVLGDSKIGDGVILKPNNFIVDSTIEKGAEIFYSVLENCCVEENVKIGPFSRIRPNARIGRNSKIGNFVEIKNSVLGSGVKAGHLAYVGDADLGNNINIGCGAIFVNYDGKNKNRSKVLDGAFIGSNSNIIAPVEIGKGAYVCAGTTITKNISNDDFVIGRNRETIKKNRAIEYLKRR